MQGKRTFAFVYLLFLLAFGVGYIAITPPFEGFDETAHYSSLRQIADTGQIPIYGKSYLDQSVLDYQGPMPYGTGAPPFDRGLVYSKFFTRPDLVESYLKIYRNPAPHSAFRPGNQLNWQAQHPPLYYLLLAKLLPILDGLSFSAQFFVLRLVSFVLALSGVALGLLSIHQPGKLAEDNSALVGFVLYPIVLPMFFPEFARIGNDSLCLFLVGLTAYLLSFWLKDDQSAAKSLAIGAVLGLGLLTKAFFIPITLGLAIFLASRLLRDKATLRIDSPRLRNSLYIFLIAILVGGGWYAYKFLFYGDLVGADYAIRLERQGGMMAGFKEHFSFFQLIRGALMPLVSYQWVGTWSVTRLPEEFQVPMLALAAWIVIAYLQQLRRRNLADPAWLPLWIFCLFFLGLFWQVLIGIALYSLGAAGGWYLHILMPWVAPALGLGVVSIAARRWTSLPLFALLIYSVAFHIFSVWAQLALFTGCATKGDDKHYVFAGNALCLDQTTLIINRLAVLGYPTVAMAAFSVGLLCLAWLASRVKIGLAVERS